MKVIDLFAGCGGLSLGFKQNGALITKALEFDSEIAETYKLNYPETNVLVKDIKDVSSNKTFKRNEADIIIGGPPCQGFSMAGARIRKSFIDDPRNYLFRHYLRIVKTVKPKIFIIENVKGIKNIRDGAIFNEILKSFSNPKLMGNKYHLFFKVFKAKEFGIPQKRERMIIIGTTLKNVDFEKCFDKTKKIILKRNKTFFDLPNIRETINNLPSPTKNGIVVNPKYKTQYQKYLSTGNKIITNHIKSNHSDLVIKRIKKIKCGENFTKLKENIKSIHSGSYGRLSWTSIAPTITTRFDTPAGGRFTHPSENRTITPREAARIQSFPDGFVFSGSKSSICKQIGNAVPPKISYFLAVVSSIMLKGIK